jgi:hypothetical protein
MPISVFELLMGLAFLGAILIGVVLFVIGLRQKTLNGKLWHFGVGLGLPLGAWLFLVFGVQLKFP